MKDAAETVRIDFAVPPTLREACPELRVAESPSGEHDRDKSTVSWKLFRLSSVSVVVVR